MKQVSLGFFWMIKIFLNKIDNLWFKSIKILIISAKKLQTSSRLSVFFDSEHMNKVGRFDIDGRKWFMNNWHDRLPKKHQMVHTSMDWNAICWSIRHFCIWIQTNNDTQPTRLIFYFLTIKLSICKWMQVKNI